MSVKLNLLEELQAAKLIEHFAYNLKKPESIIPKMMAMEYLIRKTDTHYSLSDNGDKVLIQHLATGFINNNTEQLSSLGDKAKPFLSRYKKLSNALTK